MAKIKVQITVDEELLARVDEYAEDNYMNRSGLFCLATNQFLNAQAATKAVVEMAIAMRRIADKGEVDEETLNQLEQFEKMCKVMIASRA
jgi:metal-responsive CopG/Arc/MetJ family transcriptional regulator